MALAAVFMAPSAHAHDQLVQSSPEPGATVKNPPKRITLTFSGELKPIGDIVKLTDADNAAVETTHSIAGTELTITPVKPLENGTYSLVARVVSSDGHPIDQKLAFTVKTPAASASPSAVASPAPASTTAPAAAVSPSATAQATPEPEQAPAAVKGGIPAPLVWSIAGLVGLGAVVMIIAKTRAK
ncbi:hypothetical protein GCM10023166_16940 [Paeniglutamicibacter cryotolerans]